MPAKMIDAHYKSPLTRGDSLFETDVDRYIGIIGTWPFCHLTPVFELFESRKVSCIGTCFRLFRHLC